MKNNSQKHIIYGSMLIEIIIVLGIISVFTPLIYTHISSRKSEIENMNKANVFLLLRKTTEKFLKLDYNQINTDIQANSPTLGCTACMIYSPTQIDPNISAKLDNDYLIGVRREIINGTPTLSAMIVLLTDTGNDSKAGKVAGLIGVSGGVYSAADTQRAYGMGGVWSEEMSEYFGTDASLIPSGSPVVVTKYNQEKNNIFTSDILANADLNMDGNSLVNLSALTATGQITSPEFCITQADGTEDCITQWRTHELTDLEIIRNCNDEHSNAVSPKPNCRAGYDKTINTSCDEIANAYNNVNAIPKQGDYAITSVNALNELETTTETCLFQTQIQEFLQCFTEFYVIQNTTATSEYTAPCDGTYEITVAAQSGLNACTGTQNFAKGTVFKITKNNGTSCNYVGTCTVPGMTNASGDCIRTWYGDWGISLTINSETSILAGAAGQSYGSCGYVGGGENTCNSPFASTSASEGVTIKFIPPATPAE